MKPLALSPLALAVAAIVAFLPSAPAQDNGIALELNQKGKARRVPLEERRIPALQRIELQLVPYVYEGRTTVRHDEVSSNVLSVHVFASGGKPQLRAGHSLAPNLNRIAKP